MTHFRLTLIGIIQVDSVSASYQKQDCLHAVTAPRRMEYRQRAEFAGRLFGARKDRRARRCPALHSMPK